MNQLPELKQNNDQFGFIHFQIAAQNFGVHITKVREFLELSKQEITEISHSFPYIKGVIKNRGGYIPLIELSECIGVESGNQSSFKIILVCLILGKHYGFIVDKVSQIYNVGWSDLKPYPLNDPTKAVQASGIVSVDQMDVIMLDVESIASKIEGKEHYKKANTLRRDFDELNVVVAEDSETLRQLLYDNLTSIGVRKIELFSNGKDAYDHIHKLYQKYGMELSKGIDLLISDIEMPGMSGLSLCKKISEEIEVQFPRIIFSSVVSEELIGKKEQYSIDYCISKPEIQRVVEIIEELF